MSLWQWRQRLHMSVKAMLKVSIIDNVTCATSNFTCVVGNVIFVDEGSVTCVDIDNVQVSVEARLHVLRCYMFGWMQCYMT